MDARTKKLLTDMRPPEELPLQDVLDRLDARDKYASEYRALQDRHEALKREEQDREAAREAWHRCGGDPKTFDREWKAISNESKRFAMLEAQRVARETFARYGRERF